ncbi:S1C family serine protease [Leifsonia sp. TF02-11]|uniref:S1C family serine protease n=1 Tax=Leifsonia sp. TF02-11 TaxID=2815212 RepID=UPI001AA19903|nr:trypsin-like peptidase domain-containing protein [Leifsonia sp. TF02-11]MBO1740861.1 trypsin-like peptidase domain-containing protein [Leifsonia sp. TF02-11]
MTDTPITPDPAKPQNDAETEAVVDAGAAQPTPAPAEAPAAAQPQVPAETQVSAAPQVPAEAQASAAPQVPAEAQTPAQPQTPAEAQVPAQPVAPAQPQAPVEPPAPAAGHGWTAPAAQGAAPAAQQPTAQQPTAQQPTVPQPGVPAAHQPQQNQAQPTQPVAPQQPYGQPAAAQPNYGNGSFGQPNAYGQAPYAQQHAGQQPPYLAAPGTATAEKAPRKRNTGLIIATLAIGALIGGVAGAGAGIGLYAATGSNATIKTVSGPQNITVNDANNATTVTAVAAKASPSVVTISVTASSEGGTGSGVVLSSDGYILTNTHVVTLDGAASNVSISVTDNDGKIYTAKIVGTDPTTDLAVIKLDGASGMTPITWGDSSKLNVGDTTVAIGAPLGLSGTVTDGIVSALNRSISIASSAAPKSGDGNGGGGSQNPFNFDFPNQGGGSSQQGQSQGTISLPVIQTDASINPGNSGGALLDSKGQLIGINVAIASAGGSSSSGSQSGSIGVGFSIPSNVAKRISDELIKNGSATHGLLGANVGDAGNDSKATTVGASIKSVVSGGAAAGAGLQAGDVVVNFNGLPITDATDLTAQVRALAAGSKADVTYIRDGQTKTTTVTLGSLPAS